MRILAFDTALSACSAAVYDSDRQEVLAAAFRPMETGHAEALGPMVRALLEETGLKLSDFHRIASTVGPGTFTGLRIGLAFARGLGLASQLPVVGITTLKAIAANVAANPMSLPIAVVLDARRGNVYSQLFSSKLVPLGEPLAKPLPDVVQHLPAGEFYLIGSARDQVLAATLPAGCDPKPAVDLPLPHAARIAELAAGEAAPAAPPQPLYLRPPSVTSATPLPRNVEVRQAGPADAAKLSHLHALSFDVSWDVRSLHALLALPGAVAFLAQSPAGEALGLLLARSAADEAEILSLAVTPGCRRRGLASRLIAAAAPHLAAAGARRLYIEVAQSNIPAQYLYEKAGFVRSGIRRDYYRRPDGKREHAVLMGRPLPIANHGV